MLEYEIITGNTAQEIHDQMKEAIAKGWRPQGGISIAVWYEPEDKYNTDPDSYMKYAQAIVREDTPAFAPGQDSANPPDKLSKKRWEFAKSAEKALDSGKPEEVRAVINNWATYEKRKVTDLDFLREMRDRLRQVVEKKDPTQLEFVQKMVQDWIDELEE